MTRVTTLPTAAGHGNQIEGAANVHEIGEETGKEANVNEPTKNTKVAR